MEIRQSYSFQTYPFSWSATKRLSVPRRVHSFGSRFWSSPLAHCLSLSSRSHTLTVSLTCPAVSLLGAQLGPTTTEACRSKTALNVLTGLALKVFSTGEKSSHPTVSHAVEHSFSWAAIQTDMKLFYFGLPYEQWCCSKKRGGGRKILWCSL